MKILVTGHKGFCGSHLFNKLKEAGHMVVGYDRGDMFMFPRVDVVYHLAANPKVEESVVDPRLALENIQCTFNVLEWMRASFTKKIIFASSVAGEYLAPYNASKLSSEKLIESYCHSYNMGGVSLRFGNIYGDGDRADRFIPTVLGKAKRGDDIYIYGKKGDFIHINDVVDIYVDNYKNIERGKHKVYEIKNKETSLVDVADEIIKLTNSKSKIILKEGLKCLK